MYFLYSLLYTLGFILMLPVFAVSAVLRTKHAAGFFQRLGFLPEFKPDARAVVWLHCVSVGETNAARPLVDALRESHPDHRLIVSTVTRTGQKLAREVFKDKAVCVFYVPFDFRWTVRRALHHFEPQVLLLMETELWFNLIRETNKTKARIAIVNGRLSERSLDRYTKIKKLMKRILGYLDLALMQENADATRIMSLGLRASKVKVLGNIKFDHALDASEDDLTEAFRKRFGVNGERCLIVAASTHKPEEKWILEAFTGVANDSSGPRPRLLIAPRHPERFNEVADLIETFRTDRDCEWKNYKFARRSGVPTDEDDVDADVILLDSIGELRAVYPLADIVFVGGSLIPHGGQSVLEPAFAGKAVVTGPYTHNFQAVVDEFLTKGALLQLPTAPQDFQIVERLSEVFSQLLENETERQELGEKARFALEAGRGTTERTLRYLEPLLRPAHLRTGRRS